MLSRQAELFIVLWWGVVCAHLVGFHWPSHICIYKVFVYLSSPANQIIQLCLKQKLEIPGVWKSAKRIYNSITKNFVLTIVYLSIYKWAVLIFLLAYLF